MSVPGQLHLPLFEEPSTSKGKKRRLVPGRNQPEKDLVMTPRYVAQQIVDFYAPSGRLLDPARGQGAFYDAMRQHSDDVHWCEIREGVDFLRWRQPVDWIITNPPWSKFRLFLQHAMRLAPNIVFLGTLSHFVLKARLRDIERAGYGIAQVLLIPQPPFPWPASGFQPAAALVRRGATSIFDADNTPRLLTKEILDATRLATPP